MVLESFTRNVIVLGGSYGGARVTQILAERLPPSHRVIMIDRNSHVNHLYVLPRFSVLPGHEHKAFIPYSSLFPGSDSNSRHLILHAKVTGLTSSHINIDRTFPELGLDSTSIPYDYSVYALGSHLPAPIDIWTPHPNVHDAKVEEQPEVIVPYSGSKSGAIGWMQDMQKRVEGQRSVLVVGGGALGIQFATDIADLYPDKKVTLLHSRSRLLPRFDPYMHTEIMKAMDNLGIEVILGERLDLSTTTPDSKEYNDLGQRVVRTEKGRRLAADLLLLCTGQIPNTAMLTELSPDSVDPSSKLVYVLPTLQISSGPVSISPPPSPSQSFDQDSSLSSSETDEALVEKKLGELLLEDEQATASSSSSSDDVEEVATEPDVFSPYPNIFVVGDAADAFGAIKAGHNAYFQAEVAARNIVKLIKLEQREKGESSSETEEEDLTLDHYAAIPPAIKVSVGLKNSVYQFNGAFGQKEAPEDLDVKAIWHYFGYKDPSDEEMRL